MPDIGRKIRPANLKALSVRLQHHVMVPHALACPQSGAGKASLCSRAAILSAKASFDSRSISR